MQCPNLDNRLGNPLPQGDRLSGPCQFALSPFKPGTDALGRQVCPGARDVLKVAQRLNQALGEADWALAFGYFVLAAQDLREPHPGNASNLQPRSQAVHGGRSAT